MKNLIKLSLLSSAVLALAAPLSAQDTSTKPQGNQPEQAQQQQDKNKSQQKTPKPKAAAKAKPKVFVPSEEISEDLPVSFPIDI